MFSPDTIDMITKIFMSIKDIFLGAMGGITVYLFDYSKARRTGDKGFVFRPSSMIINALLGAFVGYSVGTFLPLEMTGRDGIIAFSGLVAYNLILLAESKLANVLFDRFLGKKG